MKTILFKKYGLVFLPVSALGIILYALVLIFCFTVFRAIDLHSHSVSDTLYGIFPYVVGSLTVLFWIASNYSGNQKA